MITLQLFKLGYIWDLDLNHTAKLLNNSPQQFRVEVGDPVRNIGEPDIYNLSYSFERMFSLFPGPISGAIYVGVTAAPIEGNFFAKTGGLDRILISLFQTDEFCERSGRTKEEYIVHTLLCQLLWLQYKSHQPSAAYGKLFHEATRGCIFDFCSHKPDMVVGLQACLIDPICKGKLIEANVPESLVNQAEGILNRIRTPTFLRSLEKGLQKPLFSFLLGGLLFGLVINVLSSLALGDFDSPSDYYVVAILLLLAFLSILGNYMQMRISSKKPHV